MKKLEKHHLNVPFVTSKSSFEVGLKVHIGKKHSNIEQIDGHGEVEDNNRYENTEEYWREGRLGNANFTFMWMQCILLSTATHLKIARKKRKRMY